MIAGSSGTVVSAPVRLFREEAQPESIACPSCGGPITRGIVGVIETIACPYCGSHLAPQDTGALAVMLEVRRQQRQSALALHMRGELDGATWEVVGIQWREVIADGQTYPWQEFLLYNPYLGYRYLLFFLYDRHWAIGRPLDGAPQLGTFFTRKIARFGKEKFRHFQCSQARVTYVEGEFPWQVRAGDSATADDYVAPPRGLSVEVQHDENGADIAYTAMEHLEPDDVWRAFKLPGRPPAMVGVGPLRPNRWKQGSLITWLSFAGLFVLWTLVSISYAASRDATQVFQQTQSITEPMTAEIDLGPAGDEVTLEIELVANPLSNAWAFAEVVLVPHDSDEAIGAGIEADEWHGVEGGESWSEGNPRNSVVVGGVPTGKYTLQVTPQAGQGTDPAPPAGLKYTITIRRDVVLIRYVMIPFFVIVLVPLVIWFLGALVEAQRWKNSDYAPSS